MFSGCDERESLRTATMTEIQGFPTDANQQSIGEIVRELKRAASANTLNATEQAPTSPQSSIMLALAAVKAKQIFKQDPPLSRSLNLNYIKEIKVHKPVLKNILYQAPVKNKKAQIKKVKSQDSVVMIAHSNENLSLKSFVGSPQSRRTVQMQDSRDEDSPHMLP